MFCDQCGRKVMDGAAFCPGCGKKLESGNPVEHRTANNTAYGPANNDDSQTVKPPKKSKWWLVVVAVVALLVVAAVIVAVVMIGKDKAAKKQYAQFMADGEKYLEELDYEQAETAFLNAIEVEPKEKEPYLLLADIYVIQERFDDAEDIIAEGEENCGPDDDFEAKKEEIQESKEAYENREEVPEADGGQTPETGDMPEDVIPETEEIPETEAQSAHRVEEVELERIFTGNDESAVVTAYDVDGNVVWTYTTEIYPATQLEHICEVGIIEKGSSDGFYCLTENTAVVALNLSDGTVRWRNEDFGGASISYAVDRGRIYLTGYFSPDFFAIDFNGNTVKKIQSFDNDYYWPYDIQIQGDQAVVTMEGTPSALPETFTVNLSDFSYQFSGAAN